uniref:Uncharacterized protein n=1 Tax=Phlebotomus papatasi TaxID=29031 RepID=A0A1B0D5L2_PHLPP
MEFHVIFDVATSATSDDEDNEFYDAQEEGASTNNSQEDSSFILKIPMAHRRGSNDATGSSSEGEEGNSETQQDNFLSHQAQRYHSVSLQLYRENAKSPQCSTPFRRQLSQSHGSFLWNGKSYSDTVPWFHLFSNMDTMAIKVQVPVLAMTLPLNPYPYLTQVRECLKNSLEATFCGGFVPLRVFEHRIK